MALELLLTLLKLWTALGLMLWTLFALVYSLFGTVFGLTTTRTERCRTSGSGHRNTHRS